VDALATISSNISRETERERERKSGNRFYVRSTSGLGATEGL